MIQNEVNRGQASMAAIGGNKPELIHLTKSNDSRDTSELTHTASNLTSAMAHAGHITIETSGTSKGVDTLVQGEKHNPFSKSKFDKVLQLSESHKTCAINS